MYLAGHSFGGATALETMSNLLINNKMAHLIKGVICMDAWYFPLSESTYKNLQNQNILFINTENFFNTVPYFYFLEDKQKRLRDSNERSMQAFMISQTDHLCVSDFVFTFGNMFKLTKTVKRQEEGKRILELHEIIISLFIEGENSQRIMEVANQYATKNGLVKKGIRVHEETRFKSTRTE